MRLLSEALREDLLKDVLLSRLAEDQPVKCQSFFEFHVVLAIPAARIKKQMPPDDRLICDVRLMSGLRLVNPVREQAVFEPAVPVAPFGQNPEDGLPEVLTRLRTQRPQWEVPPDVSSYRQAVIAIDSALTLLQIDRI